MVRRAVTIIVTAQLFGTSLWFSANGAADDLARDWGLTTAGLGWLTNSVQAGFVAGTLVFAFSGLADRYRASRIVLACGIAGGLFNAGFALLARDLGDALVYRFAVGVCLAGIYPLGMKLLVTWAPASAGRALGLLVGMLTLGTALPHGIRSAGTALPWQGVVLVSSALAVAGAAMVAALGEGPHFKRGSAAPAKAGASLLAAFRAPRFRASAFGYFGHMWELYAFWTLLPLLLIAVVPSVSATAISGWAFAIIGAGTIGCVVGGRISMRIGSARVAGWALFASAIACLLFPLSASLAPAWRLGLMLIWGLAVVADSPQFSAMSARECPPEAIGGALALQNGIGFGITMIAITVTTALYPVIGAKVAWVLLPGPLFGLWAMRILLRDKAASV